MEPARLARRRLPHGSGRRASCRRCPNRLSAHEPRRRVQSPLMCVARVYPVRQLTELTDEPHAFVDAPIGLQIVAPRFNDGVVLAAMNAIEEIIKA